MPRAKSPGRPFKKGQSGNPLGPRIDPVVKAFRETKYKDFINGLQKYGSIPPKEIKKDIAEGTDLPAFEVMFARIVLQASEGDKTALQILTDRLWGKVKDSVEISTHDMDDRLKQIGNDRLTALMRQIEIEVKGQK